MDSTVHGIKNQYVCAYIYCSKAIVQPTVKSIVHSYSLATRYAPYDQKY